MQKAKKKKVEKLIKLQQVISSVYTICHFTILGSLIMMRNFDSTVMLSSVIHFIFCIWLMGYTCTHFGFLALI